jgi:hypothetical protein
MIVRIKHKGHTTPIWYCPEDDKLTPGCKIYNFMGGWCCYCTSDEILETHEELGFEDLFRFEGRDSKSDFSFLEERIDLLNIGEAFKDNSYLQENTPSEELEHLLEDTLANEYTPIGICFAEEVSNNYGDNNDYRPLVLENNKGERIWIHIPYTQWVNWSSLQKKK